MDAHIGSEGNAMLPLQMINEGYKANSPGMLIADVRFKGGLYVELNHTNQHVEYIYVSTIATTNYEAFCGMAYDVPARSDTSTELVINPGTCSPVPGRQATRALHGFRHLTEPAWELVNGLNLCRDNRGWQPAYQP